MWIVFAERLTHEGPKWAFVSCEKDSRAAKRRAAAANSECQRMGLVSHYAYCKYDVYRARVIEGAASWQP